MAWLRIDDRFRTHPKMQKAGIAGWLNLCGICYCREHLTDGVIPREAVQGLAPGLASPYRHADRLVSIGVWHVHPDGFQIHDFLDWNPSRSDVEAGRDWETQRKGLYRDKDLTKLVRARDMDCCRYCNRQVNWADRRGPCGGQHDHVIPRGPSTIENVVVACRECNRRKANRTPEEAGMVLLPARNQIGTRSDTDPTQVKTGFPSRAHAGDAGSGCVSGSGSSDLDLGFWEGGPGETAEPISAEPPNWSQPSPRKPGLIDGQAQRRHQEGHAWCSLPRDGFCVPKFLHAEFTGKLGSPDADARLREWYPTVVAQYADQGVGDDLLRFWRNSFAAWVGTVTSAPADTRESRTLAAYARTKAAIRGGGLR